MHQTFRTKMIGALLCLAFIVSLIFALSVPAQAKSTIPVVMSTANGDKVGWNSNVGSNNGYWEITAVNDDYGVNIRSGVTDHEAGTYEWSDLNSHFCFITIKAADEFYDFTDGSCTVTVNGEVVNVSGVFKADNDEYYAVDITYGTAPTYAQYKNTTTVIKFDDKDWYLIDYDDDTVTLLAKECVGASTFGSDNTYAGSTVETAVNNYYAESISTGAKTAVSNNKMFLLSTDEAEIIYNANPDVLKCSKASDAEENVWWLCSQGYDYYYAAGVYGEDGEVDEDGYNLSYEYGVRPALQLDLSKVEYNSETKTFAVPAAPVTEWHVGDTINLGGKNFVHDDKDDLSSLGYDRDNTVPTPTFSNIYEQWFFENVIYYNESDASSILLTPPTGKTKNDKPIGFKIKSGDGTQASPYEFELVYPVTFGKVNSIDDITADNIGECTFDDAKEWIYANWDTVIADADGEGYVDIVYFAGEDLYYIYLANNDVKEYWYTGATSGLTTSIDELINWVDELGDSIYLCGYKAPAVKYLDENGDEQSCASYFLVNSTNNAALDVEGVAIGSEALGGDFTWIVVGGEVTFTNRINVAGTVNVILKDNATLTAEKGIEVSSGNTLNIYAQSDGDDMGALTAGGSKTSTWTGGIGSDSNYGTITINGGNITAAGGMYAPGIGGKKGGAVTVNGGTVTATGKYAPGIGSYSGGTGGTFTFNGGTVIANGGDEYSAGIGGYDTNKATGTITLGDDRGMLVSDDNTTWSIYDGSTRAQYMKVCAEADTLFDGLWVGGTEVTDTVTSGDGWSYNASTNTLTLTDYYYDGDGHPYTKTKNAGIYYKGESPLNIVVEKTQYYSYIGGYENNFVGIYAEGGVVLTGEGRLIIYGNSGGIIGDVTVDGCVLEVTCGETDGKGSTAVTNLTVNSGKVTVDGGTVVGNGSVGGYAVETLTVNGGIVYAYGGDGYNSYEPTTQSAVKTLTVSGGVLYAEGGVSNWNSDLVPAVVTTADGGSITVGKDVKVYGADIRSSERHDMPNTLIEEEDGDFDRFFYMIFEGASVSVKVPYKDHAWTDGALVTTDKEMTCSTMTFGVGTSWSGNYYVDHNVTFGTIDNPVNITLTGNTNIIFSDTATLYVYGTIDCGNYTLNVYGNEKSSSGPKVKYYSGITVKNTSEKALALKASKMNIHGGTVEVNSTGNYDDTMFVVEADGFSVYAGSFEVYVNGEKGLSALASASTNVYGGSFNVSGGQSSGENVEGGTGFMGSLCVYGGYVNAYGGDAYGDGADGGIGIIGNVEVYGGQVSTSGGYSSAADGGVAMLGGLCVYGGTFDADGGYANIAQKNNTAISATVTLGEGVGYFEGKTLFAEGPEEEMESGDANYAQIKGGAKYVYVDATTGAVTTAYTYETSNRIDDWLWSNWYIVEKDTTINNAVYFETNEVNIIIADGVTLTFANGLNVPEGKTLKIYAQSMDEATMGTLIAMGANGSAGIGGENGGNVCIYGGNVEATGDTGAAGIDGIVYIYGGKVTATGGEGSVGINGDLTVGEGIMLYGDDDVNPPTTVIEEESGNYHRTQYMTSIYASAASISGTPTAAQNLTYTGSAQVLITADPTVQGGTVKYSTDQQTWYTRENFKATNAGKYTVYYYVEGDASHRDSEIFGGKDFTVEIGKKTVTVTADAVSKASGEADPKLTYTAEGLVGNDTLSGSLAREEGDGVGTYAITQGTLKASDNYVISFTGAVFTIGTKTITVQANAAFKMFGDADPELTYTVSGADGVTLSGSLARAAGENVGTYEITIGSLSADGDYAIDFTGANFTIGAKTITVRANAASKKYGDADPELTYTISGAEGVTLTGSLARAAGENVGTYAITQGTLTAGGNYTILFVGESLTVTAKEITVKANAATKAYGDADPKLTYTAEGLVGSDTLAGALARADGESVGTYAITQGTLAAGSNYVVNFTGSDLTISAKTVVVTANDQSKVVGASDPELTYTATGLVGGDTLSGALAREAGEAEGTYAITQGTLAAGENYVISFTGATLTIYENKVETDVNVDEGAPEMEIENINEEAANSLLTEEEKEALENGEQVKIYLEVIAVDEEIVPEGDKTAIENEAKKSGTKVGMYLDLSLLKEVGENGAVAIHDTEGNMVKVTVTVPENLRNTDPNVKRTFYVVRVHDGVATVLGESTGDTVSFETDKFSTYSLTYKDEKQTSLTWLWIILAVVVVAGAGVAAFFVIKKKKNGGTPTDNTDKSENTAEPEKSEELEKTDE